MLDRGRDQPTISFPVSEGIIGHRTNSNDNWGAATSSGFWASNNKPPKSYNKNYHSWNEVGVLQLGTESSKVVEDDESGMCSPPLWTTSPPRSPHHRKNYYRSLSPTSKTQAIARGQRELMEMVRNMPESSYELSLKDLVEHPRRVDAGEENKRVGERNLRNKNGHKREGGVSSSSSKKVVDKRSGNIDSGGFYLKMVFPISFGSNKNNNNNKKKKNESFASNNSSNSKVSPRTSSVSDGSGKGLDKEWWKKKSLSGSGGESDSGVSSINSGSMKSSGSSSSNSSCSRSNSRHEMSASSCWPFIRRPESLSHK